MRQDILLDNVPAAEAITPDDIGRHVSAMRKTASSQWFIPPLDAVVVDVVTIYPAGVKVKVALEQESLWLASTDIRLLPPDLEYECNCVLPEHSCPACRSAARLVTGGEIPY